MRSVYERSYKFILVMRGINSLLRCWEVELEAILVSAGGSMPGPAIWGQTQDLVGHALLTIIDYSHFK